jgi:hypothetical protein
VFFEIRLLSSLPPFFACLSGNPTSWMCMLAVSQGLGSLCWEFDSHSLAIV